MEGIDDLDKSASLVGNAFPRRSTSSLAAMSTKRGYLVLLGVLAVIAIALRLVLGLNLGVSTLVLFVGWPLVGTLITLDDDFRGGWSNPDGTVTPVWKTSPFWADIILCRGAVVLVAFAIESREHTSFDRTPGSRDYHAGDWDSGSAKGTSLEWQRKQLTIGSSDRGSRLRWAKEGIDDWDKSVSFCVDATPRRSTSSLDAISARTNNASPGIGIFAGCDCRPCNGHSW
jgi:hypothetical protein